MSQAGILDVISSNPHIPTQFDADSGIAIPISNTLEILGDNGITTSGSGNTITVSGVNATAATTVGAAQIGVSAFDSDDFTVTDGFVQLTGSQLELTITGDSGGPLSPIDSNFNILGDSDQGSVTSGSEATITITNLDASETQKGVSELATNAIAITGTDSTRTIVSTSLSAKLGDQTEDGLSFGQGSTSAIGWTSALTDGQIVIGSSSVVPAANNLSSGTGINILNASNSITISVNQNLVAIQFSGDSGSATASSGVINILGGNGIITSATGNSLTVEMESPFTGDFTFQSTTSGEIETFTVQNTIDAASSGALIQALVAGSSSSGNPTIQAASTGQRAVGFIINTSNDVAQLMRSASGSTTLSEPIINISGGDSNATVTFMNNANVVIGSMVNAGVTNTLHIINANEALNSDVQILLQTGDPTVGLGGGKKYIRWGSENQNQYSLGQLAGASDLQFQSGSLTESGDAIISINPFNTGGNISFDGTGALTLQRGTTAERPSTEVDGMVRYNSTTALFEGFENAEWVDLVGGDLITGDIGGAMSPSDGNWNILGITVAAGTEPIETSGSGNTLTIEMQFSQTVSSTDGTTVGLSNFDSTDFTVDSNGFVQLIAAVDRFTWTEVTGTTQAGEVDNGYITNNIARVTVTMPATASVGDVVRIAGKGAGGWSIAQNVGQTIHFGTASTTTGITGSLDSTATRDCVELLCETTNTDFVVLSSIGNIAIN